MLRVVRGIQGLGITWRIWRGLEELEKLDELERRKKKEDLGGVEDLDEVKEAENNIAGIRVKANRWSQSTEAKVLSVWEDIAPRRGASYRTFYTQLKHTTCLR